VPTVRVSRTNKRLSIEVPARAFRKSIQIHACHDSTRISCRRFKVGSSGSRQIEAHLYVSRGDQGKSGRSLSFLFPGNGRPDIWRLPRQRQPCRLPSPGKPMTPLRHSMLLSLAIACSSGDRDLLFVLIYRPARSTSSMGPSRSR